MRYRSDGPDRVTDPEQIQESGSRSNWGAHAFAFSCQDGATSQTLIAEPATVWQGSLRPA